MPYNAKNCKLHLEDTDMDYIVFGNGKKELIIIPGLGDGLKNVKNMAAPYSLMYKEFAKKYRVYMFSRRNLQYEGFNTRDMAKDVKFAMDSLGIEKADIIGISQGGMIAQYLAVDFQELINRLVLVVTSSRPRPILQNTISRWMVMAERKEDQNLMTDMAEKMYRPEFVEKNRWLLPLSGKIGAPKSYDKFLIMSEACLTHDAYKELPKIQAPTLVIGARHDKVLGWKGSKDIAEQIPNSRLFMYEDYGHGVYLETEDFQHTVLEFLGKKSIRKTENVELTTLCMVYDKDKLLLQKRLKKDWPGYVFPGGHVEPGESIVQSVIREMKEETGLTIRHPQLCGVKQFPIEEGRYIVFLFKTNEFEGELTDSEEGPMEWVERNQLDSYELVEDFYELLEVMEDDSLTEFQYVIEADDEWIVKKY